MSGMTAAVLVREGQFNGKRLQAIRETLGLSQAEFASRVRKAGDKLGDPNACTKRLIQKWESGDHRTCRPNYRRALCKVTGLPFSAFCGPLDVAAPPEQTAATSEDATAVIDGIIQQLVALRSRANNLPDFNAQVLESPVFAGVQVSSSRLGVR